MLEKVEALARPGSVPLLDASCTSLFCEGELPFLCVLFVATAQTDGFHRV